MQTRARRLGLFAYYFPPLGGAGSQRALSFARHLPDLGWDVTVITPEGGVYGRDPSLADGLDVRVKVIRTATWEFRALWDRWRGSAASGRDAGAVEEVELGPAGRALRRVVRSTLYFPDAARGWIGHAVAAACREHALAPFDVVLASSPPLSCHVAAVRFAEMADLPVVLDFRDLPDGVVANDGGREAKLLRGLLSRAACSVTVSPSCAEWFGGMNQGAKPAIVMNGFEPGSPAAMGVQGPDFPAPYFAYAGTAYEDRQNLTPFLEILESMEARGRKVSLRIAGKVYDGARKSLQGFAARGLVSYEGFLEKSALVPFLVSSAGILVWAWEGRDVPARSQVPAKLFEAAAVERPVLLVCGEGSDAEAVGRDLLLRPVVHGDRVELEAAVRGVVEGPEPAGLRIDRNRLRPYLRANQARILGGILDGVAEKAAQTRSARGDGSTRSRRGQ